jgi:hypothetical protein
MKTLAQAIDPFGTINEPEPLARFGGLEGGGIGKMITLILRVFIIGAGLYALVNLILAGYAFLSAGDDPKKIEGAWAKIWQSLLGLAITAGAFVLAAIFGKLIFNDFGAILNPSIPTLQ